MNADAEVLVIGAGPAGAFAALRAADLGARTILLTSGDLGGMAADDGPAPVRTLAQAARLMREARKLGRYGVDVGEPRLDYPRLMARVAEVVDEVRDSAALRPQLEAAGVDLQERAGPARFVDPHTIETQRGRRLVAEKIILCVGGVARRLPLPGFDLTATHSDAWGLTSVPPTMLVIGSGATGAQVASVFNAFGARVTLFETGPRILRTEEPEVSAAVAAGFRQRGIEVIEDAGEIAGFDKTEAGVAMRYGGPGAPRRAEASLAVAAVGWRGATDRLNLGAAGVELDPRGFVKVDRCQRTSAPQVWAAGDVTGHLMLAPQAMQAGFAAATNAVTGAHTAPDDATTPIGSFTDPEYAQVGLSEAAARRARDIVVATSHYASSTRPIVDGCAEGFCKLIVDAASRRILGCHIVGDRAVDVVQLAAVAMAGALPVDRLARLPLSFPTYAGVLGRAAASAARDLTHAQGAAWAPAPAELG